LHKVLINYLLAAQS